MLWPGFVVLSFSSMTIIADEAVFLSFLQICSDSALDKLSTNTAFANSRRTIRTGNHVTTREKNYYGLFFEAYLAGHLFF